MPVTDLKAMTMQRFKDLTKSLQDEKDGQIQCPISEEDNNEDDEDEDDLAGLNAGQVDNAMILKPLRPQVLSV